jgi:hypothetical protein
MTAFEYKVLKALAFIIRCLALILISHAGYRLDIREASEVANNWKGFADELDPGPVEKLRISG